jgi:hypothetical protein
VRGQRSEPGATRVSPNGYHYTRTEEKWICTHVLVAEEMLGRKLTKDERCRFLDGDRTNLDPNNIVVYKTRKPSASAKRAQLEAKLEQIQEQLDDLGA